MEKKLEDLDLLKMFHKGDLQAFRTLYERHSQGLFHYIVFMLKDLDAANDVFQALFVKLIKRGDRFLQAQNFKNYLFAAARNEAMEYLRGRKKKEAREREMDPESLKQFAFIPTDSAVEVDTFDMLFSCLNRLPVEQREAVVLHIQQDLGFAEIAKLQKVPMKTVASRYYLAIEKLKNLVSVYKNERGRGK